MDGRRPTGIMFVNTNVDSPAKEAEYSNWYQAVHFPDVCEPGIFVNALMFHNLRYPPPQGEAKFLAFYETFWPDIDVAYAEFSTRLVAKLRAESRIHAGTRGALFGVYRQLSITFSTERRKRSQSVMAVHIDAKAPGKEQDVRGWYAGTHVAEVAALGLFHTGSFNELIDGPAYRTARNPEQPRFLALYESDIGDPQALGAAVAKHFPGGVPDYVKIRGASSFYRVSP